MFLRGKLFSSAVFYMKLDNISKNICCKIQKETERDNKSLCVFSQ